MARVSEGQDPGNCKTVSLMLVLGKVMEQVLSVIMQHRQHNQGIRPGQHRSRKDRECSTKLVSLCEKVTCSVDEDGCGCCLTKLQ